MIIDRYIAAEVIKPFLLITVVLGLMFAAVSTAALLDNVLAGKIELSVVAILIFLRTLIALEVLLPSALYIAVIVALRRLHRDAEMAAFWSLGMSDARVLRSIFLVILGIALLVSFLSLEGRPWAYKKSYAIEEQASLLAGVELMQADRFITVGDGSMTVFFDTFDEAAGVATDVFVQQENARSFRVIRAERMQIQQKEKRLLVQFHKGYAYELAAAGATDGVLKFTDLDVWLNLHPLQSVNNKRKALATEKLLMGGSNKNIAEFQWRWSAGISTFLLGVLAIPLGRMKLRRHGSVRIMAAVVFYAVFFNLTSIFRTWLEHGEIATVPGLWSVHIGIAGLLMGYFLWRRIRFRF